MDVTQQKIFLKFFLFIFPLGFAAGWYAPGSSSLRISSEILLQTETAWNGDPITYPEGEAEVTVAKIVIAPGSQTGWHSHPVPSFAYIVSGTLEITLENGESHRVSGGEAVAEVFQTVHRGINTGDEPAELIVFYTGIKGVELTRMAE